MPEYDPRGREFTWPTPWELMSPAVDWYADSREKFMLPVDPANVKAAADDLAKTLAEHPATYWPARSLERALANEFNIATNVARRLLRDAPGSATPQQNVWCARAAADGWQAWKRKVRAVVGGERASTIAEIHAALGVNVSANSVFCALMTLAQVDKSIVALGNIPTDEPRFTLARPGGRRADYTDLAAAQAA